MSSNAPLDSEERLEILEALRRGNLSHHEIAKRFNRAQSTISKLARDAGITPTHRRRRTPAARDVEGTYGKEERINFVDRILGVLGGMVDGGGLSPREAREVTQAAKTALDARRAEDQPEPEDEKASQRFVPIPDMGDWKVDPNTATGRAMLELEEQFKQGGGSEANHRGEYGAGPRGYKD